MLQHDDYQMATDPEKLRRWTAFITKEIAERPKAKSEYVLLRSEQLVGTCIIIFMKNDIAHNIKNVEAATKKVSCFSFFLLCIPSS